jgi:uncharacterized protein (TIGR02001 family)
MLGSTRFAAPLAACAALLAAEAQAGDPAARKVMPPAVEVKAPVPIDFVFGARIQSDYNFRGISQSNRKPSPQAYGELQFLDNSFYLGLAFYRVDLPTKPQAEVDFTGGWRPKLGPVTLDFGYIYYAYPGERRLFDPTFTTYFTPANTDFLELAAKASWAVSDAFTVGGGVFHAWDWLGSGAPGTYGNLTAKYNLPFLDGLSVSGELGHYWLGTTSPQLGSVRLEDYLYWNAGVAYNWKNFTVDFRYHDTTLSKAECFTNTTDPRGLIRLATTGVGTSNWCGAAFIATLSVDITASAPGVFATR